MANRKCYGQEFGSNQIYPTKAHTWNSPEECKNAYEEYLIECDKFGYTPVGTYCVFLGEPDGDEEQFGYPEFPDFIIEMDVNDYTKSNLINLCPEFTALTKYI